VNDVSHMIINLNVIILMNLTLTLSTKIKGG